MIYKNCETCKRPKLFFLVKKRKIRLPMGQEATSKKTMCNKCNKAINNLLNNG